MISAEHPIKVVCAVIINKHKDILACQRSTSTSQAGKWEFPGGKIEAHESNIEALKREIIEELGVDIQISNELETVEHQYPELAISLSPYLCKIKGKKEPLALEHEEIRWVSLIEAKSLDWSAADQKILSCISLTK